LQVTGNMTVFARANPVFHEVFDQV